MDCWRICRGDKARYCCSKGLHILHIYILLLFFVHSRHAFNSGFLSHHITPNAVFKLVCVLPSSRRGPVR
ncbi:hypothetical protein GCK32_010754 [Trichostrongylus colubriformis]|uniref:Uncharacterized protein n=1 Tax=Trichostrongylus colubriformis TaxID=6319 RepID=A0AAN8FPX2_TRICO